ncbi:unnamed protein product [Ostreobium quekettii]|uniref:Vacuolar protein sorting 55 n=1 Tax=Ostreobium quekettii TaxID=121088 RepID=A0A8S1IYK5_9CHLO|nr:unnamed protein product [Ostreobium quekettii]
MVIQCQMSRRAHVGELKVVFAVSCRVLVLALMFSVSVLLQLLGCALFNNWWPMLTALLYVFVPMPYLFFGSSGGDSLYGDGGNGWSDWGKFLTGFSAVGMIAIPASLRHAAIIKTGALVMEVAGALVLFATVFIYDYFSSRSGYL